MLRNSAERIRRLPNLVVLVPLLVTDAVQRRSWPLSLRRRRPSSALPLDVVLVQRGPIEFATTRAAIDLCSQTSRILYVDWPPERRTSPGERAAFEEWHRNVVGQRLLPYVKLVPESEWPKGAIVDADRVATENVD